eukprot:COSAG04_NODE_1819_length_5500_cov_5.703573_1_plen_130_part_00
MACVKLKALISKLFLSSVALATLDRPLNSGPLEIYESTTDSWSTAASMPTSRYDFAAAIVGNTLFALGGASHVEPTGCQDAPWMPGCEDAWSEDETLDVVMAYDIDGDSWSTAEPMGTPRGVLAAVAGP